MSEDHAELVLNRTWRPALSLTGVDGMPPLTSAGNVLRPVHHAEAVHAHPAAGWTRRPRAAALKAALEKDPPYGAKVRFERREGAAPAGTRRRWRPGWSRRGGRRASHAYFGKPAMAMGEGGTIPFMGMLGSRFPEAQFLITGVLGPGSNAHGPNEFLHIPTGKKLTACVASVIAQHARR